MATLPQRESTSAGDISCYPAVLRTAVKKTPCISAIAVNDCVRFDFITGASVEIMVFWEVTLFRSNLLLPSSGLKLAASRS